MSGSHHIFSVAVVAPSYNNAATLASVLRGAFAAAEVPPGGIGGGAAEPAGAHFDVIVVNDGSTDDTAAVIADVQRELPVVLAVHPANRGKAAALQTGFAAAAARGHSHVVTIDTDGQLDPAEIPILLAAARAAPDALIVGVRDEHAADYPARSRLGRRVSNLFVRLESGARVADSQCGFRVYPLDLVRFAGCGSGHYGFETEILTRAAWAGAEIIGVPVSCRYLEQGQRISHFRPGLDTLRAVAMHARLTARALLPIRHPRWRGQPGRDASGVLGRLARWLNPARAWRELREQRGAPQEMATGVAVGVFIANLPLYGMQTILSLYAARRLHLNPLAVVAGSHVSTPPIGPVLIAAAVGVGHWLLHGRWLQVPQWQESWRGWARLFGALMLEWSLGSLLVGAVLSAAAFVVAHAVLRRVAEASPSSTP